MLTRVPLQAVLFDWDGTLLNSYLADGRAYLRMFEALGIPWSLSDLTRHYSPDWHNVYRAAQIPPARWGEADRLWRWYYGEERPALQPGARRVLQTLSGRYRLGLVTSGSAWRVRSQLHSLGLNSFFSLRVFGDEIPRRKPHPAPLQIALRRGGLRPTCCVYVGDAPEDIQMARRAGVAAIGILDHSPVPERLRAARPDATIRTIAGLPQLLSRG
jgi:phosphoglycolate phosphatase